MATLSGTPRSDAIDQTRQDLLTRTSLTFLPRPQDSFLEDYIHLPGSKGMLPRDRIKLIPDDYRRKFLRRVHVVVEHSIQADVDQVSEFNWEADAWRDIFGRLRDDERLRMDKREYNYKATVLGPESVRDGQNAYYKGKRIPDITFGLSSYFCDDPEDEGIDERERRIRRSLQKTRLRDCNYGSDGHSLVTDGKWGHATVLFPFAVYEAKKNRNSEIDVKIQLKLAFNTYLQMLDRLVRRPEDPEKYQLSRRPAFPIFGFTSNGSRWTLYVGYLPNCAEDDDPAPEDEPLCDKDSHMRRIWWGDVYDPRDAGELLVMVDQIHEYAVTTHRPFVARHLKTWEAFTQLNQNSKRLGLPPLSLSDSASKLEPDWISVEASTSDVRRIIRNKRKQGIPLTDDEVNRGLLVARLRAWQKDRPRGAEDDAQVGNRRKKVIAYKTRKQPHRRTKASVTSTYSE